MSPVSPMPSLTPFQNPFRAMPRFGVTVTVDDASTGALKRFYRSEQLASPADAFQAALAERLAQNEKTPADLFEHATVAVTASDARSGWVPDTIIPENIHDGQRLNGEMTVTLPVPGGEALTTTLKLPLQTRQNPNARDFSRDATSLEDDSGQVPQQTFMPWAEYVEHLARMASGILCGLYQRSQDREP